MINEGMRQGINEKPKSGIRIGSAIAKVLIAIVIAVPLSFGGLSAEASAVSAAPNKTISEANVKKKTVKTLVINKSYSNVKAKAKDTSLYRFVLLKSAKTTIKVSGAASKTTLALYKWDSKKKKAVITKAKVKNGTVVNLSKGRYYLSAKNRSKSAVKFNVELSTNTKSLQAQYAAVLKSTIKNDGKAFPKQDPYKYYLCYSVYDINNDGIPELIVRRGSYNKYGAPNSFPWVIYTSVNGNVKRIGSINGYRSTILYKPKENGIYNSRFSMTLAEGGHWRWVDRVDLVNGKLKETLVFDKHEAYYDPSALGLKPLKTSDLNDTTLLKSKVKK